MNQTNPADRGRERERDEYKRQQEGAGVVAGLGFGQQIVLLHFASSVQNIFECDSLPTEKVVR
jgi:hypothetical protein